MNEYMRAASMTAVWAASFAVGLEAGTIAFQTLFSKRENALEKDVEELKFSLDVLSGKITLENVQQCIDELKDSKDHHDRQKLRQLQEQRSRIQRFWAKGRAHAAA